MTRIAGMAGNRGRNLLNIADRRPGGAELAVVLATSADAPVLESAEERGIPTEVVPLADDMSRTEHEEAVLEALSDYEFDLVCLDGYMRILSSTFLDAAPTTLNVHPSLLPSFPGMDAWGDALEAGVSVTGCTVHVVTDATDGDGEVVESEVDGGPIVTQEPIPIYEGDDPERLKERVLYEGEFRAYPRAVQWFAEGAVDVDIEAGDVRVEDDVAGVDDADNDGSEGPRASDSRAAKPRDGLPGRRLVSSDRLDTLRYGENPHQDAAVYADYTCDEASVVHADQLNEGAKALSYNNYNDADGALNLIKEFDEPAAAVIKHTNPAGCATADSLAAAYEKALSTDPMSAFGGIVALNRECDAATAEQIIDSFKEVVVAPGYTDDALDVLFEKENLRVLDVGELGERTERFTEKPLVGGRLVQERDLQSISTDDLEVVTEREPTEDELESMVFAWQTLKHVKSNGILFADGTETVGIGMGQVSRVDAVRLAAMKADEHAEGKDAEGAVMASDAFFPFPDGIEEAADAGIEAVVQPGGSVNDDDVIEAADEHGIAMAFTGQRSFRHD
ncbi:phosphoribosylglycinamide formyltransferase / phosphoribosylaminoimidazolecarboxamide formyltransferase [Natrialba magadii ATCC 43099]|uniref:Phosphoribosylglycinamide formyltransferase n=1 Tax=Natrialba magadii (strain ATCC 43099 / DSM 3394 / CCM 3739 / CIP 104546 / IAM 13178 / JCM 8861 / NBRC 102185 / NCIMB 2190 / MS3) TaxID=547559 RepID=D3SZN1_NATMM|nr:bifunctional phosphoribosylaminoimidazolecarboxamide formyltransferase/IMP cyclohydrolase [Natrialba magadii]ADD06291.1 phosphoribosylglycinamide formyltransferase / phosphoribosylaminoimidazolecarboxamide formyltransferase [Natrialba magadii ATCC 43099]ELY31272.1 phosphoribosylglycinamide formyltransferase [Natrialba magadii ATCC 43099]